MLNNKNGMETELTEYFLTSGFTLLTKIFEKLIETCYK